MFFFSLVENENKIRSSINCLFYLNLVPINDNSKYLFIYIYSNNAARSIIMDAFISNCLVQL